MAKSYNNLKLEGIFNVGTLYSELKMKKIIWYKKPERWLLIDKGLVFLLYCLCELFILDNSITTYNQKTPQNQVELFQY